MNGAPEKRSAGRPTEYRQEYCDKCVEWGRAGKSKTWMAAEMGVSRQTLENWLKVHDEFKEAIERALAYSQQWWEDYGQEGMGKRDFNAQAWSRSMAARFREEWTENRKNEHIVQEIAPVVIDKEDAKLL